MCLLSLTNSISISLLIILLKIHKNSFFPRVQSRMTPSGVKLQRTKNKPNFENFYRNVIKEIKNLFTGLYYTYTAKNVCKFLCVATLNLN